MGRLLLVRHAQASFLSSNYDQLSALGETQARLLGEYWAHRNTIFDRVASGPGTRHRGTAELVCEAFRNRGVRFPEPLIFQEFDEFQGDQVLSRCLPQLLAESAKFREWHDAAQNSPSDSGKRAYFQKLFGAVITMWVNGEIAPQNVESWHDFCARVNRGLSQVIAGSTSGETVVVFTSGGPVSVAMQRALHLSAQDALRVAWMPRNCSFSEFIFSGDRFTLSSFNAFPHLDEVSLLTYR